MILRIQKEALRQKLAHNKLILIQGPRHVGKRTVVRQLLEEMEAPHALLDCSEKATRKILREHPERLKNAPAFIVLHEAQYIDNLQYIIEQVLSGVLSSTLIVLCSYVPELDGALMEALQQENLVVQLYAPSFYEAAQHFGLPEEERLLEERLIYGNYPEVLSNLGTAEETLQGIIKDAIFTKLSGSERINKGDKLLRMLHVLAFSIGDTISYHAIAERCDLDNETVERYILLLENAFLLFRLPSYETGQRYELKKSHMFYFADNGVRNVLIRNFNPTSLRNDMNELWRNYVIAERMKWLRMHGKQMDSYFWKTHTRQQMDYLEKEGESIRAWKTDWQKRKKVKFPLSFLEAYPDAKTSVLNRSTYWTFLSQKLK
ncbi:MAG: hypothetical protein A3D92_13885 [Bacteroidetes bacterium RIFCSPHIGHO2_02_FULL_44_7]|nr:MAG: hypothetical protein A3D92_13885 [Bacteroidetes bacterium RIFCSPHIGHO2_02_FULL_44_7]